MDCGKRNLTLLTDLYQLTMMNGYFQTGAHRAAAVFDLFFRENGLNYAVAAGLEQAADYVKNLKFGADEIAYLKSLNLFSGGFLEYLRDFKFTGGITAVREGEVVFPSEPILTVRAPLIEAQLIETALLNIINHQTLIATKAARVCFAAGGDAVVEFGLRRAHGADAGLYGSRAAAIGGCAGTSDVLAGFKFGLPVKGTHSHGWVLSFTDELTAFRAFADVYPDACLLLVDTFDTLKSGLPNALTVFKELRAKGHKPLGIRLDSGDLAYLSKKAREILDGEGFTDAIIFASGDVDEFLIENLKAQGAKIDAWGVGTRLITGGSVPSLGGVYKLGAVQIGGKTLPRMKISDNAAKMTLPGLKKTYRIYDKCSGKAFADLIALDGEKIPKPLTLVHPSERWKRIVLCDYEIRPLHADIFKNGEYVYDAPTLPESAAFCKAELGRFWDEYRRLVNPHIYKVDLSDGLYGLREKILAEAAK